MGPLSLLVTLDEDHSLRVNLDNLWATCGVDPASCATNAQRMVSGVSETFAGMDAPPDREAVAPGSPVMTLTAGDSYESSRVLLHDMWQPLIREVEGELLVSAPARDRVLFTENAHAEDVTELRRLAEQSAATDGHALAAPLLRWTADGWVVVPTL